MGRQSGHVRRLSVGSNAHGAAASLGSTLVWVLACGAEPEAGVPTYHADVAPIVARSCLACHAGENPAHGVSLADYPALKAHGLRARELIASRRMPKGGLDRSGACERFDGHVSPSARDIDLFSSWVDARMPEGRRVPLPDSPEPRAFVRGAAATLPAPYWPAADEAGLTGDHRCFSLTAPEVAGAPMSAFRVVPTAPELVHHVLLFGLDTPADTAEARELDESDPEPGWACFGSSGVAGARLLGAWAPGTSVVSLPPGLAVRLGTEGLVAQVHYDGPAALRPDQTRIELEIAGDDARSVEFLPFAATDLALPPGRDSVEVTRVGNLGLARDVDIVGVFPHMHSLGRSLRLRAYDAESDRCLANVLDWDYTFQELAFYVEPPRLRADALLELECRYSTLGVNGTVSWGERAEDEMCMVFVVVSG